MKVLPYRTVAVAGLGSVGLGVALSLDRGIVDGLRLTAVSARHLDGSDQRLSSFSGRVSAEAAEQLGEHADIVVECLPPDLFPLVAAPVLRKPNGILVVASVGALLVHDDLIAEARRSGARIIVPSGAIAGLDGLRAAAQAGIDRVSLSSRKPPTSFGAAIEVDGKRRASKDVKDAVLLFRGSAREAVSAFPKNINVAATISLAGIGADRTEVEIWADPAVSENTHELRIWSQAGSVFATSANLPDPANPKSSIVTGYSILAALRRLTEPLTIGS